jgi:hypothetical protein
MTFRIGDKVRRIDCSNRGGFDAPWVISVGDVVEITGIQSDGWLNVKHPDYPFVIHDSCPRYFEPVKDKSGARWARGTLIYKTVKAEMQGKPEWPALRKELIVMLNEAKEKFSPYDFNPKLPHLSSVIAWSDTKQGHQFWSDWADKLKCGWA